MVKLGKNQQFVLSRFTNRSIYPHDGVAQSAWLTRILKSLEKRGLIAALPRVHAIRGGVSHQKYTITESGDKALQSIQSPAAPSTSAEPNKTIRQSAHIADSYTAKSLTSVEMEAWNEGVLASVEHPVMDALAAENAAYEAAGRLVDERIGCDANETINSMAAANNAARVYTRAWLANAFLGGYYKQLSTAKLKEAIAAAKENA